MSNHTSLAVFAPSTSSPSYAGLPTAAAALFAWPLMLIAAALLLRMLRQRNARSKIGLVYSGKTSRAQGQIIRLVNTRGAGPIPIRPGNRPR